MLLRAERVIECGNCGKDIEVGEWGYFFMESDDGEVYCYDCAQSEHIEMEKICEDCGEIIPYDEDEGDWLCGDCRL